MVKSAVSRSGMKNDFLTGQEIVYLQYKQK